MTLRCCAECIDDRALRKQIIPSISTERGTCGFCRSNDVDLVEPGQLADLFEMLVDIYKKDCNGRSLIELMKEDWFIFSNMENHNAKKLLREILDDDEFTRMSFSASPAYTSEGLARWETLRDEILYKNRYFLDEDLDADRLEELLNHLIADEMPKVWYRARILADYKDPYLIKDMGAPPKHSATYGRANPVGIPYLYLSSTPETAASEVRPFTGEEACVADFKVSDPMTLVDLRKPRKIVSPFVLSTADAIGQLLADIPLLERLGDELMRPILPKSAAIDYIPSQYLCEFIKKKGYDGVVYRSSVSDGYNMALFNPNKAQGVNVSKYRIEKVTVDVIQA